MGGSDKEENFACRKCMPLCEWRRETRGREGDVGGQEGGGEAYPLSTPSILAT